MMDELRAALWLKRGGRQHTLECFEGRALDYVLIDRATHAERDLLLIPGLGEGSANWLRLSNRLEHLGRCIAIDGLREPSGAAGHPQPAANVEAYARAVCALLAKLARPTCLIGGSMGGIIALRAASAEPTHVLGVIVLGLHPALTRLDFLSELFDLRDLRALSRLLGQCWFEPPRLRPEDAAALLRTLQAPAQRALLADVARLNLQAEIARAAGVGVPTFFLTGAADGLVAAGRACATPGETNTGHPLVPASRVCELPGCGHYPHVEQAGPCASWIEDKLVALGRAA